MSQRDLVAELRATRPSAPGYVREQVRLIAATATPPQRRLSFTWRRAFVVAVPLAAAVAAAVVLTRPSGDQTAVPLQADTALQQQSTELAPQARARKGVAGAATTAPAPSSTRAQIYGAYLSVQVATPIMPSPSASFMAILPFLLT